MPQLACEVLGRGIAGDLVVFHTLSRADERKISHSVFFFLALFHHLLAFLDQAHHAFAGLGPRVLAKQRKALVQAFNLAFGFCQMLLE